MKKFTLFASLLTMTIFQVIMPAQAAISTDELSAFGKKIYDIHARQAKAEYLELLHPQCPAPVMEKLNHDFSDLWLKDEPHDIRLKTVADTYDLTVLDFKVMPEAVIEIQTWIKPEGQDKTELVTGYGVTKYQGIMRIIDYPCFEPK